jgi:hypothetical protein
VDLESLGILAGSTSTAVGSRGPPDCAVQHDAPLVVVLVRDGSPAHPRGLVVNSPWRAVDERMLRPRIALKTGSCPGAFSWRVW